jgi:hypothetical protein
MTHRVSGTIDDYYVDGEGTCLTTALIAYAADCRRAAAKRAEMLIAEAIRAEHAATVAERGLKARP